MSEILEVVEVLLLAYIAINIHKLNPKDKKMNEVIVINCH